MIMLQVVAEIGTRIVVWTYDKVKGFWKPDLSATQAAGQLKVQSESEMPPLQQANLEERFNEALTPEELQWTQYGGG